MKNGIYVERLSKFSTITLENVSNSLLPYHKGNKTKFTNLPFPLIRNSLIWSYNVAKLDRRALKCLKYAPTVTNFKLLKAKPAPSDNVLAETLPDGSMTRIIAWTAPTCFSVPDGLKCVHTVRIQCFLTCFVTTCPFRHQFEWTCSVILMFFRI